MDRHEAFKFLRRARRDPKLVATDKFIDARLSYPGLYAVIFQVGPKCNLKCEHCYGYYGPHRRAVPEISVTKRVIQQALKLRLEHLALSDGEPLMDENRELVGLVAEHAKDLPVQIITNGKWAETLTGARDWMNFLKAKGFNLRQRGNMMRVSTGTSYKVPSRAYGHVVQAVSEVFGGNSWGSHLGFYFLSLGYPKKDTFSLRAVIRAVDRVLGKDVESDLKVEQDYRLGNERVKAYLYYPVAGEKGRIPFIPEMCAPEGRAKRMRVVRQASPRVCLEVEDVVPDPLRSWSFCIDHKGRVGFGAAQLSLFGKGIYGNVMSETLFAVMKRIFRDKLYQASHLGGFRFLYHLAQEVDPKFRISAVCYLDFSQRLFAPRDLMDEVRKRLKKEKVVPAYKRYIKERGVPRLGELD